MMLGQEAGVEIAFVRLRRQGLELLVWAIVAMHTNGTYLHADDL